jgi:hypothetical protein
MEYRDTDITIYGYMPAHPYLWENLDCVLSNVGGKCVRGEIYWQPQVQFHHLRKPWPTLTPLQKFFLKMPPLGVSRIFDRFV